MAGLHAAQTGRRSKEWKRVRGRLRSAWSKSGVDQKGRKKNDPADQSREACPVQHLGNVDGTILTVIDWVERGTRERVPVDDLRMGGKIADE